MKKRRIWISSAGTGNAFAAILSIRQNFPNVWILASDINPSHLVTASNYSDNYLVSPPLDSPNYIKFMVETIHNYQIDTYIPFIDTEVTMAAIAFENGKLPANISIQLKSEKIARICEDKLLAFNFLRSISVATPFTSTPETTFKS